jgi:hypothetical protein
LTPDAPTNDILLYVKTLGTGAITWYPRASPAVPWFRPVYGGDGESWRLPDEYDAWLSPDGGRVVFWTRLALNQADTDKVEDVYIRDLRTGSVTLVSTRADGTKLVGENTYGFWAPDGKRVLFKANGELHGLYIKELG